MEKSLFSLKSIPTLELLHFENSRLLFAYFRARHCRRPPRQHKAFVGLVFV